MKLNLISWNINMFNPDKPENLSKIISEINNQGPASLSTREHLRERGPREWLCADSEEKLSLSMRRRPTGCSSSRDHQNDPWKIDCRRGLGVA